MGADHLVLNIGGNIRTIGVRPDGTNWEVGLTNPDKTSGGFATKLNLGETACVTSGNYHRYYVVDGVSYHHIIDPDTLMPANYFSSVTVITENSALADALSTALFCMSYEEGKALIESLGDIEVIWIDTEYNIIDDGQNHVLTIILIVTSLIAVFGIIFGSKFLDKSRLKKVAAEEPDEHDITAE